MENTYQLKNDSLIVYCKNLSPNLVKPGQLDLFLSTYVITLYYTVQLGALERQVHVYKYIIVIVVAGLTMQ